MVESRKSFAEVVSATDDEKAALAWMKRRNWKTPLVVGLATAPGIGVVLTVLPSAISMVSLDSPGESAQVLMMFMVVCMMGAMSSIAFLPFSNLLNVLPFWHRGERICNRTVRRFVGIEERTIASSTLPSTVRRLHVAATRIWGRYPWRRPEDTVRALFRKGGPGAALEFLRLCSAFPSTEEEIKGVRLEADRGMEETARKLVTLLESNEPREDANPLLLRMPAPHNKTTAIPEKRDGDVISSLLGSGVTIRDKRE